MRQAEYADGNFQKSCVYCYNGYYMRGADNFCLSGWRGATHHAFGDIRAFLHSVLISCGNSRRICTPYLVACERKEKRILTWRGRALLFFRERKVSKRKQHWNLLYIFLFLSSLRGDVSERTRRVIQRGIRSGSDTVIGECAYARRQSRYHNRIIGEAFF